MGELYQLIENFKKNNNFDDIYYFYRKKIIILTKEFRIDEYISDMFYNLWIIVKKINLNVLDKDYLINSYILRSLKNFAINYYRKKQRDNIIIYNTDISSIEIDKKYQCDFDDSILIFNDMLKNILSEKQYNIINLRYAHSFSDIEIATQLRISRQAVYKNRLLALSRIKEFLVL